MSAGDFNEVQMSDPLSLDRRQAAPEELAKAAGFFSEHHLQPPQSNAAGVCAELEHASGPAPDRSPADEKRSRLRLLRLGTRG